MNRFLGTFSVAVSFTPSDRFGILTGTPVHKPKRILVYFPVFKSERIRKALFS